MSVPPFPAASPETSRRASLRSKETVDKGNKPVLVQRRRNRKTVSFQDDQSVSSINTGNSRIHELSLFTYHVDNTYNPSVCSDVSDPLSPPDTNPFFSSILRTKAINKFLNNPYYGLTIIPVDSSKKLTSQNNQVFASIRKPSTKKTKAKGVPEPPTLSQPWSLSTKLKILFVVVIHMAIIVRTFIDLWTSPPPSATPPPSIVPQSLASKKLYINITAPEENFPSSSGLLNWTLNGSYLKPSVLNSKFNLSIRIYIDEQMLSLVNGTGAYVDQVPSGKVLNILNLSLFVYFMVDYPSWTCHVTWPSTISLRELML